MKKWKKLLTKGIVSLTIGVSALMLLLLCGKPNNLKIITSWFVGGISMTAGFIYFFLSLANKYDEDNKNGD